MSRMTHSAAGNSSGVKVSASLSRKPRCPWLTPMKGMRRRQCCRRGSRDPPSGGSRRQTPWRAGWPHPQRSGAAAGRDARAASGCAGRGDGRGRAHSARCRQPRRALQIPRNPGAGRFSRGSPRWWRRAPAGDRQPCGAAADRRHPRPRRRGSSHKSSVCATARRRAPSSDGWAIGRMRPPCTSPSRSRARARPGRRTASRTRHWRRSWPARGQRDRPRPSASPGRRYPRAPRDDTARCRWSIACPAAARTG
jgi:hypothetical protein